MTRVIERAVADLCIAANDWARWIESKGGEPSSGCGAALLQAARAWREACGSDSVCTEREPYPKGSDYWKGWEDALDRAGRELLDHKLFSAENLISGVPRYIPFDHKGFAEFKAAVGPRPSEARSLIEFSKQICPITEDYVDNSTMWHCPDCEEKYGPVVPRTNEAQTYADQSAEWRDGYDEAEQVYHAKQHNMRRELRLMRAHRSETPMTPNAQLVALELIRVHASGECAHTADDHMKCFAVIEEVAKRALSPETGSEDR